MIPLNQHFIKKKYFCNKFVFLIKNLLKFLMEKLIEEKIVVFLTATS